MSDKPKTIQEALAEVQRNVLTERTGAGINKVMNKDDDNPIPKEYRASSVIPKVKQFASDTWNQAMTGEGPTPVRDTILGKSSTPSDSNAPATSTGAAKPAATTGAAKPAGTTAGATGVEKTPAPSPAAKPASMSFSQAYAKARELAKAAGKDPNLAQFKWGKEGGPEKTFQAAETKKDYVAMPKQFKVDIGAKEPAGPPMSDYQKPQKGPEGPPMPKPVTANVPTPPSRPSEFSLTTKPPESSVPGSSTGDVTPVGGSNIDANTKQRIKPQSSTNQKEATEMNPLIAAFLKLQETKAPNIFEAAKKLSPKQDKVMDVVDDDKIDAKDLAALRAGKKAKMDEDEQLDEADPANDNKKEGPAPIQNIMSKSYKETNPSPFANSQKTDPKDTKDWARRHLNVVEDEEQIDELKKPTPETAEKVVNRATDRDEWSPKAANRLYSAYKKRYAPKEKKAEVKEGMLDPKDPSVQGGGDVTSSPVKSAKPAAPKKVDGDPSYQGSGEVTKGGKPTSVREGMGDLIRGAFTGGNADKKTEQKPEKKEPNFIQKSVDSINPLKKAADAMKLPEEVSFSEEEIAFFNSVMEAEPVNKTPVDASDKSTDKSASKGKIDITDERKYK